MSEKKTIQSKPNDRFNEFVPLPCIVLVSILMVHLCHLSIHYLSVFASGEPVFFWFVTLSWQIGQWQAAGYSFHFAAELRTHGLPTTECSECSLHSLLRCTMT